MERSLVTNLEIDSILSFFHFLVKLGGDARKCIILIYYHGSYSHLFLNLDVGKVS